MASRRILVSGATGYVGGRLVPCLLEAGYTVRCFVRDAGRLHGRPWRDDVEVAVGDVLKPDTLPDALEGVDVAYYLIHSLGSGEDAFAERDRRAADNFGRAARDAGVQRIVYLGGIQPKGDQLSDHLRSRLETGEHLRRWDVPVTEFRAAVVVGSGSLSFEMIRHLVERLPFLICPQWVQTPTQPIAIRDVLGYLVEALEVPESAGEIIEIGGADVLTYGAMFRVYAQVRGLRRVIVNVPVLTPRLSSHWVGLVTPLSNEITRPLIEGLDNEVVVDDPEKARRLFSVEPIAYETAVRLALQRYSDDDVPTIWTTALSSYARGREMVEQLETTEGMTKDIRQIEVQASPEDAFAAVERIGGDEGWLYAESLWRLRGYLDLLSGGVGFRKGRRQQGRLRVGDAVDFWRVEAIERDPDHRLLRLRAEMKVPGKAWLQFEVEPTGRSDTARLTQTAFYEPKGLWGLLYWYVFYIPHQFIFPGMIEEMGRRAERLAARRRLNSTNGRQPASAPATRS